MNQPDSMTLLGTLDKKRSESENFADISSRIAQVTLIAVLALSPWAFGSVFNWTQAYIAAGLLIPLGIYWFETAFNSSKSQHIPYVSFLLVGGMAIAIVQIIPLGEYLSSILLGRQQSIYQEFTGVPPLAGRISLFPEGTWHQFQLLMMAFTAMLLASRYFRSTKEMIVLLSFGGINGVLLGTLGMLQKLSSDKIFWLFEFAHGPFATFVNRNNAAGYLLMALACLVGLLPVVMTVRVTTGPPPLISREMPYWRQLSQYFSFFLTELNSAKILVLTGTIIIASSIIASASRGGSLAMLVGMVATFLVYGLARRPQNLSIILLPVILLVVSLSAWVGFSDKLFERWQKTEMVDVSQMDARIQHWRDTWPAIEEMGPLGAGLGSYRHVHRLYTQVPETSIFVYAENQFFQSLVESGLPGFLLFLAAWILAFHYAWVLIFQGQSATTVGAGTMGIFLLSSQAIASLFDFGLYIPANIVFMAILVGLLAYQAHAFSARLKKRNWLSLRFSNRALQVVLLAAFCGLTVTGLNLYRRAIIDTTIRKDLRIARRINGEWDYEQLGLAQTTRRIEEITTLLGNCRSIDGLNHLGDLWIHRFRLMSFELLEKTPEYLDRLAVANDAKERLSVREDAWNLTRLERMRDYIQDLGFNFSQLRANAVTKEPFIVENVPQAYLSFAISRAKAPLQPIVHFKLGQLNGLLEYSTQAERGKKEIEQAIQLAPNNPQYRLLAGVFFVQGRDLDSAAVHFKRFLEISPHEMKMAMDILFARTELNSNSVPPKIVFEKMIPDDPLVCFQFAKNWCKTDPETRIQALNRTEELLAKSDLGELNKLKLKAEVHLEKSDLPLAIETMGLILRGNPLDENIRFQRANLLFQGKRFNEALEETEILVRSNRMHRGYNQLLKQIEAEIRNREDSRPR